MDSSPITQTLARLRHAADVVYNAWPTTRWTKLAGPGPDFLDQDGAGSFAGLSFEPGKELTLATRLNVPATIAGVPVEGDPLEATIFSLYPAQITWEEEPVFEEDGVPVAAGPALVTIIPKLKAGDNGELVMVVRVPDNQTIPWFNVYFTTPNLRARFELLDVTWAELAWADALAVTDEERAAVNHAATLVPDDLSQFSDETLKRIEDALALLTPKAAAHHVHVIGHSHIDMNWLWTLNDTHNVIYRDFKSIVAMMDDYPEMTFTHSQPATYEIIRQQDPALFAKVVSFIGQGRWEPATMTWVEGDVNMASGEAHARHFLEAVRYTREVLHAEPTTMLEPDTFGHAGNLPQLAVNAGAQRYYHHRANEGQADLWPAYWWEGQDGTRILSISTHTYNGNIRARDLILTALRSKKWGQRDSLHFHGIGDHGGGPARQNMDALRRFQQRPLLPSSQCSTLERYTKALLDAGPPLPVHRGESSTIFEGCYTTHSDIKRYNRYGENMLCTAETLAALAGTPSQSLQGAWRKVLFNQFHDILDGSGIHEGYASSARDFEEVTQAATEVTNAALKVLQAGMPAGSIAITNPLGWAREDWVCVPAMQGEGAVMLVSNDGHRAIGQYSPAGLGFVARVPAFGTTSYQSEKASASDDALSVESAYAPTDNREPNILTGELEPPRYEKIETPFFRVYLRRDSGILVSFFDKRVNRELVGYGLRRGSDYIDSARADLALNVLQFEEEHPHGMSSWHLDEVHTTHSLLRGAVVQLIERGPARLVFSVEHHLRQSTIRQHIIFYRDLPRVDFKTWIDWQELGSPTAGVPNLKVAFTARLRESEAWFETPFAAVQRPCDGQESPALRWADVGGAEYGIALLNDCKYGYDALGTRLRLTLVRSGYEPDAISDVGQHEMAYSFFPHAGDWRNASPDLPDTFAASSLSEDAGTGARSSGRGTRTEDRGGVVREAAGFNQPLLSCVIGEAQPASDVWMPQIAGSASIIPSGLKMAYGVSGKVIRLYESAGLAGEIEVGGLPAGCRVWEANLVQDKLAECAVINGRVRLAFHPWQVRTLLID
jgi:alpha-mannosidase